jgi:transcriptional regulator with XRE-family HTH domain
MADKPESEELKAARERWDKASRSMTAKKVPLRERRKRLRKFREQYGITLAELGNVAQVSESMLAQFESGEGNLSVDDWARIVLAMRSLLADADAKRSAEISTAGQTTTEPSAPALDEDALSDKWMWSFLTSLGAVSAEDQHQVERAREKAELNGLLSTEMAEIEKGTDAALKQAEAQLLKPGNSSILLEGWKQLWLAMLEHHRQLTALTGKGNVFLPQNVEQVREELKKRVTELGEELHELRKKEEEKR